MSSALAIAGVHPVIDKVNLYSSSGQLLRSRLSSSKRCRMLTGTCKKESISARCASKFEHEVVAARRQESKATNLQLSLVP